MFSSDTQEVLNVVSVFGYTIFLFLIGVKTDVSVIKKTGGKAWAVGVSALVFPLIFGLGILWCCTLFKSNFKLGNLPFVATTYSLTSFTVVACLLQDLKIINSELGRVGLSSALVCDIMGLVLTSITTLIRVSKKDAMKGFIDFVALIGFTITVLLIIHPAMKWVVRYTPEGQPVKDLYVYAILLVVLVSGLLTDQINQTMLLGPFILGLAVPAGPPLGSAVVRKIETFTEGILMPIFTSVCAIKVNLTHVVKEKEVFFLDTILFAVTFLIKVISTLVPALIFKIPSKDGLALALIMSCKGIVQLALYSFFFDNETIDAQTYALQLISILITAIVAPNLVKYLYDPSRKYAGYQKRNITNLKPNAELRVLTCIHTENDFPAMINLLEVSCPTKGNPISVYALHLIELIGRSSPLFISHQTRGQNGLTKISHSENVIFNFNQFEINNQGAVTADIFTAVSPFKLMHEDICTLALNKLACLIVLPFHQRWSTDGSINSQDNTIRALNRSVIERAPCSIGIIVDRAHLQDTPAMGTHHSVFRVAMIFLGGNDDREALVFSKRMAKDPKKVSLTVLRLLACQEVNEDRRDWEEVLDMVALNDFKQRHTQQEHVTYIEKMAPDCHQTAFILRSIVNEFDLIVVGRRQGIRSPQTLGLTEWSEFPELGTVGDLLASSDLNGKASILVVQQQRQMS
ncbi:Cation/H(+) antiporter like [Quillaja saponaria]|nr:Cation/H(+) antiporter like [Quillaja saponaria]